MSGPSARRYATASALGDLFDQTAQTTDQDAVIFPDGRATYPEIAARSDAFARALMAFGIGRRDKVGLLLPSGVDFIVAMLGIVKAGAVAAPVNGRFRAAELRHVVRASDMRMLLTVAGGDALTDNAATVAAALPGFEAGASPEAPLLRHIVSFGPSVPPGWTGRRDLDAAANSVAPEALAERRFGVRLRDAALLMFTSGTTAHPKAAILSHEALSRQAANLADTRFMLTTDDRVWNPLPLYHIGGIAFGLACFARGATYVHNGFFDAGRAVRQLVEHRCTVALPAFETMWLAVLNHPDFRASDLGALRLILNLGGPERLKALQQILPNAITINAFGATEGCSFLTAGKPDDPQDVRLGTLGYPMAGTEVRILDLESGRDAAAGVIGEIIYRSPTMFDGYYGEPALTAEAIDADGWFHSGDLGDLDDEGRLRYHGRLKDMLKVGGENVSALELEEFLISHPAIMIAQVVAAPDARYVEVPAAYIQLRPGASVEPDDVIAFCLGAIATFKAPRYVRIVDEWPMSGTKIKKVALRERIAAELRDAGVAEAPKLSAPRR